MIEWQIETAVISTTICLVHWNIYFIDVGTAERGQNIQMHIALLAVIIESQNDKTFS